MRQITWDISLQQIQIFLSAGELRNFTQVARQFNYTQSMVSKTISAGLRRRHESTARPLGISRPQLPG